MIPSFLDPQKTLDLERDGYVVVPGLFADDVPELARIYQDMLGELAPSDPYFECPMTGTNFLGDRALRMRIIERVSAVIAPRLERAMREYRFLGAGFRVKQTGPDSMLTLHQDPTMVDEDLEWSLNIIVPVVDTTADNGALRVIRGSHRYLPKVRSMDLSDRVEGRGGRIEEDLLDQIHLIPMLAGDAIFYFNAVLHGSGPNTTDQHRPVVLGTIMSEATPMVLYLRDLERPSVVQRFEVPDKFFVELENFERDFKLRPTNGRKLEDVREADPLSRAELLTLIRSHARS